MSITKLKVMETEMRNLECMAEEIRTQLVSLIRDLPDQDGKPIEWFGPSLAVVTLANMQKHHRTGPAFFICKCSYERMIQTIRNAAPGDILGAINRISNNELMASDLKPTSRLQGCILHPEAIEAFNNMIKKEG